MKTTLYLKVLYIPLCLHSRSMSAFLVNELTSDWVGKELESKERKSVYC